MYQIDNATAASTQPAPTAAGTPGFFTDGSAVGGVPATVVPAEWLNAVQQELINAIVDAGITPSKSSYNQLSTAIKSALPGRILNIRALTGSGAYTPTPSTRLVWVRGWGGGGGGQASNGTTAGGGAGGGAGGYFEWFGPISALGAGPTYTYQVGSAGLAGTASGQTGGNGGSTFLGGTNLVANGGFGGGVSGQSGGSVSIVPSGSILNVPGREGQGTISTASNGVSVGGAGGNAFAGPGGVPHNTVGGAGTAGGGGAGAGSAGAGVFSGGVGGAGSLSIVELS